MRCLLEKLILLWRLLKVTGEGSERKAEIHREYTQKIIYRILVEIRMVIAILMRSQAEIRNMLLDNRKCSPCYKVANKTCEQ